MDGGAIRRTKDLGLQLFFFLFSKGLCANSLVVELSSVFYQNVPVRVLIFVRYFMVNTGT